MLVRIFHERVEFWRSRPCVSCVRGKIDDFAEANESILSVPQKLWNPAKNDDSYEISGLYARYQHLRAIFLRFLISILKLGVL